MIYVSSACVKARKIKDSVLALAETGFRNIELSGGTKYYPEIESDLMYLQDKYELNYQVHNYFPPPEKPFVLNLASLDDNIRERSIQLCKKAIKLSSKLGGKHYGVHAGFFIDLQPNEAGKKIKTKKISSRNHSFKNFAESWKIISEEADGKVTLYLENNVLSSTNAKTYFGRNPLMLTDYQSYLELKQHMNFKLLLDVAHLKVSANSLDMNFERELKYLLNESSYIHLSDNNGLQDQNKPFVNNSSLFKKLKNYNFLNKNITLEIYDDLEKIISSYDLIKVLTNE